MEKQRCQVDCRHRSLRVLATSGFRQKVKSEEFEKLTGLKKERAARRLGISSTTRIVLEERRKNPVILDYEETFGHSTLEEAYRSQNEEELAALAKKALSDGEPVDIWEPQLRF